MMYIFLLLEINVFQFNSVRFTSALMVEIIFCYFFVTDFPFLTDSVKIPLVAKIR